MPPILGHIVYGRIFDVYGIALANASVALTHFTITPTLSTTSDANGDYRVSLSGLNSQWSKGDNINIKASKTAEGTKTVTTIIQGEGGQRVNITLDETSDLSYLGTDDTKRHNLFFTLPTHYDGEKVTRLRPFPVQTEDVFEKYRAADEDVAGTTQYFGFTDRFGNSYIQQYNTTAGSFRYTKGSSDYTTNWINRATLSYDYFNNTF